MEEAAPRLLSLPLPLAAIGDDARRQVEVMHPHLLRDTCCIPYSYVPVRLRDVVEAAEDGLDVVVDCVRAYRLGVHDWALVHAVCTALTRQLVRQRHLVAVGAAVGSAVGWGGMGWDGV